jgi:hypothetical protein
LVGKISVSPGCWQASYPPFPHPVSTANMLGFCTACIRYD